MTAFEKKILVTILFSIFITILGVGLVVPLLPVYAHHIGASGFMISMIFGALSISRTIFLPYFGKLSDQKGRKPFITAGLFSYALVGLLFMISTNVHSLILIRFFQGVAAAMIMPITQAYVADLTPRGMEGQIMGIYNMSIMWSLSLGPVFGGMLNEHFGLRVTFASMAVLAFLAFLMSVFLLPPVSSERKQTTNKKPTAWLVLLKDPMIFGLAVMRFSYLFCVGSLWCFLPVFADTQYKMSSASIGILVSMGVLLSGLLQYPVGYLADRVNKVRMIFLGGAIVLVSMVMFTMVTGFWSLLAVNILFGIGGGIVNPPLMAIAVIKGNERKEMGSLMALLTMAHSMGMLAGPFISGLIMDYFNIKYVFTVAWGMMAVGLFLFSILSLKKITHLPEK